MASKDVGLIPYLVICSLSLLFLTLFLLKSYAHISVPNHAKFIVWLSWILCFSIVYILPLDLRPHVGNNDAMYPFYLILYWFCFFLTWILTPFQSAYIKSGGFNTKERLFDAVVLSALFFIIIGIVGVIAFVYLLFATTLGASQLGAVLQAFGNLWGLSFAIMTMGYGLVEIPRYFWCKSAYDLRLQYCYFKISQIQEEKENARDRVDELLYLYKKCKHKLSTQYVYEFARIDSIIPDTYALDMTGEASASIPAQHLDITFSDIEDSIDCDDFKRKHLRKMHMLFKIWLFQLERTNAMFDKTMHDVFYFEMMTIRHVAADTSISSIERLYFGLKPVLSKGVAVVLSVLSVMIIWSEAMIIFDYYGFKPYLSIFALMASLFDNSIICIVFGVILFGYLCSCSLFALWRIHINRDYHMHPFQLTDSGSILTNCAFSMRFMFPLGYNFLLLNISKSERDLNKESYPYLYLFHDMSVLPLIGDPINVFLPMLVIVFCAATWFNVFGKLMKKLRISRFEFGDPKTAANQEIREWINEGIGISNKFKKELNHDDTKKAQFAQFVEERFSNQWSLFNRKGKGKGKDLVSVSLMNSNQSNQQQRDIVTKDNKHRFIELQHSNQDD